MRRDESGVARVAGIVLAAGTSSRMRGNKLLLEIDGEPLVRRVAREALAAGLAPVVVVLGHEAERTAAALTGLGCETVTNSRYEEGMASSLGAGITALPASTDAAMLVLADMPSVSARMLRALSTAYLEARKPIVVSSYGAVQAPPTLFDRRLFAELLALEENQAPRSVVRRHRAEIVVVPQPARAALDLDRPEDLERLESAPRIPEGERAYREMVEDDDREARALEWAEGLAGDAAD